MFAIGRSARRTASPLVLCTILCALATAHHLVSANDAGARGCAVDPTHLALDAEEQAALDQTNAYRSTYGLSALRPSAALTQNALWKSDDMAARTFVAHDDDSRSWVQRFTDCGYRLPDVAIAENLAAGNAASAATLQQWQASPGHNANLLDPQFTAVGIKRMPAYTASDRLGWYWAMELGSSLDEDLTTWLARQ